MARPPRTRFAAPFVIVVAGCGGSKSAEPTPAPDDAQPRWTVQRQDERDVVEAGGDVVDAGAHERQRA